MCAAPLRLLSPFAPAECAERLRGALAARRSARWLPLVWPFSVCGVTGQVSVRTMVALQATLEPAGQGGGTLICAEWLGLPLTAVGPFPLGLRLGRVQARALLTFLARTLLRACRPRPVA